MNQDVAQTQYEALANPARQVFLAALLQRLTLASRDVLMSQPPAEILARAFRGFTELNHQLSAALWNEIAAAPRHPDDLLVAILIEIATKHRLAHYLAPAWSWSLDHALRHAADVTPPGATSTETSSGVRNGESF